MIREIEITVNRGDLHDFLSNEGQADEELVQRRMDAYVAEASRIIREWYPDIAVAVDYDDTPGNTVYLIETEHGWEQNPSSGEAYDARLWCDEAFNRLVNDWSWCP